MDEAGFLVLGPFGVVDEAGVWSWGRLGWWGEAGFARAKRGRLC